MRLSTNAVNKENMVTVSMAKKMEIKARSEKALRNVSIAKKKAIPRNIVCGIKTAPNTKKRNAWKMFLSGWIF